MTGDIYSIAGKVALITGGSRGIGQSIAELFAERGAEVIICSRKQQDLDVVAAGIRAKGGKAHAIQAHVGKLDDIERLVGLLDERGLAVDVLVNNAGISPPNAGTFCDTTPALWDKIMEVNVRGPFFLTAALGRKMAERGSGAIVNISTTSALMAQPEIGAYCVSKAALNTMTRCFARELGPRGVRVNAISCGVIKTAMGDHTMNDPQRYADMMKVNPLKRVGYPEEVAAAALFLASDAASYSSGVILQVDGGVLS
ncbi:MAG: SDR family oxidoreductase [Rhodocyclaceae bacterium]|jgi:NAD(P)-dependent dehydrogenase (short-subunit alcohol dehydrogenase family)|nr:SDR family oxidoreductase [Rhodocyclaceae bacterium]MBK6678426.1 SDR family oxidoreductase [Rhodocyclaceae bacterium]MBK9311533.1 SDR family oxidoreductase [Rhodocyclaceae bacterium]MBK9956372.1 SDR family oxidoreductase [Rhodocyclaceae bacterium]